MPVQINYLDGGIGIEFMAVGIVTGDEVIEANKRIYGRDALPSIRYKIIDRTACTDYRVSGKDLETIVHQDQVAAKVNPRIIVALVSLSDLQYGVSRMWQTHIEGTGFRTAIFRDRQSADAWIREQLAGSAGTGE